MKITKKMTLMGKKGKKVISAMIDTGTSSSLLNARIARVVGVPLTGDTGEVQVPNSKVMHVIGGKLVLRYRGKVFIIRGFISDQINCDCLLGMDFLSLFNVRINARSGRLYFRR